MKGEEGPEKVNMPNRWVSFWPRARWIGKVAVAIAATRGGDWNKYACTHAWRKAKKDRQEEKEIEYIVFPGTKLC